MSIAQLRDIEFVAPSSVQAACEAMAQAVSQHRKVWALAGCTDWMVARHMEPADDEPLDALAVDLSRIDVLRTVQLTDDGLVSIGAGVTFASLRSDAVVEQHAPLLREMAGTVGAEQVRHRATIGGNLVSGSPAADGVTALFALDASVVLQSTKGERTVPIREFYTGYRKSVRRQEELVVRFEFRPMAPGAHWIWRKVGTRKAQSIAKASVAGVLELDERKVVKRVGFGAGSVAERVVDLHALGALLQGNMLAEVDSRAIDKAIDNGIRPIDDVRSTAAYRRHVVRRTLMRFMESLAA